MYIHLNQEIDKKWINSICICNQPKLIQSILNHRNRCITRNEVEEGVESLPAKKSSVGYVFTIKLFTMIKEEFFHEKGKVRSTSKLIL
jgi:hypothetical protein